MSEQEKSEGLQGHNRRKHVRTPLRSEVKLEHDEVGELLLHTGDISDGGAYIFAEGNELPGVGSIVHVQVQLPGGNAPVVKMEIVRIDKKGIGLQFVQE